jgi:dihydrofolate synthase/folylpolyglutamate synthase
VDEEGMRRFTYREQPYRTRLLGSYQPLNAAMAVEAARVLRERGWSLDDETIVRGIEDTRWPGRFEVVEAGSGCAAVVVDGGHNPQGAVVLAESLASVFEGKRIVFLMSVLADKDYPAMIRAVAPLGAAWVCVTSPNVGRALSAEDLAATVRRETEGREAVIECAPDFKQAMVRAKELAGEDGIVCAWGSLYSLSELKKAL